MFNLTKRQLVCFSIGGVIGVILYFSLKSANIDTSSSTVVMMLTMLPFFMFAMYEKFGQPLEVVIKQIYNVKFVLPKERPYISLNTYSQLEKQFNLNKEIYKIVKKAK